MAEPLLQGNSNNNQSRLPKEKASSKTKNEGKSNIQLSQNYNSKTNEKQTFQTKIAINKARNMHSAVKFKSAKSNNNA
jgi:hypothetical protein